jgi:hypothetical protein
LGPPANVSQQQETATATVAAGTEEMSGMSATPAGWYPQDDGSQRYWDGERWTGHIAPRSDLAAVAASGTPQAAATRAGGGGAVGFVKRHKIASGVAGAALLLVMIAALSGGGDDTASTATVVGAPRATATPSTTPAKATDESTPTPTSAGLKTR